MSCETQCRNCGACMISLGDGGAALECPRCGNTLGDGGA